MRLSTITLAAAAMFGFAGSAFAGDQDFTLKNFTGYDIASVYLSRHSASEWSPDVLAENAVLGNNKQIPITFQNQARGCHWDLMVKYNDDSSTAEWDDINLCEVNTISLHYDRKEKVTRASFE